MVELYRTHDSIRHLHAPHLCVMLADMPTVQRVFAILLRVIAALGAWHYFVGLFLLLLPKSLIVEYVLAEVGLMALNVLALLALLFVPRRILYPWGFLSIAVWVICPFREETGYLRLCELVSYLGLTCDGETAYDLMTADACISYYHIPVMVLLLLYLGWKRRNA